jgi:hypothetical protein
MDIYDPRHEQFKDIYLVEKISSNEGWIPASPEEGWSLGTDGNYVTSSSAFVKSGRRRAIWIWRWM